jgi:uncharacterized protein (TIGR02145 family)
METITQKPHKFIFWVSGQPAWKKQTKNAVILTIMLFYIGLNGLHAQTVKDIDGNVYRTVRIGTQVWMAENLKTTKYRNGNLIGTTNPATLNILKENRPQYQWAYDGNERNVATYGRLYTWYAATDSRNVCPTGWHVPSDAEWSTLTTYLGGESVAGGKLQEADTTLRGTPFYSGATNETGFTAIKSGSRSFTGEFSQIDIWGSWWSSTEQSVGIAYIREVYRNSNKVIRIFTMEEDGLSVRCLRD